jgi:hypothetical protein
VFNSLNLSKHLNETKRERTHSMSINIVFITFDFLFDRYISLPKPVHYKYRFQCPDSSNYDSASYELQLESLESFPWNMVDNVVCSHGTGDNKLSDVRFHQ